MSRLIRTNRFLFNALFAAYVITAGAASVAILTAIA